MAPPQESSTELPRHISLLLDGTHVTKEIADRIKDDFENSVLADGYTLTVVDEETKERVLEETKCLVVSSNLFHVNGIYTRSSINDDEDSILRKCLFNDSRGDRNGKRYNPSLVHCLVLKDSWLRRSIGAARFLSLGIAQAHDITSSITLAMRQLPIVSISGTTKDGDAKELIDVVRIFQRIDDKGFRRVGYVPHAAYNADAPNTGIKSLSSKYGVLDVSAPTSYVFVNRGDVIVEI